MNISHRAFVLSIFMATILFGCGNEKKLNEEVDLEFGKILNDPSSLQLRNIKYFTDDTVCGEFNTKNDKGGYVGFQPFIYQKNGVLGGDEYEAALGRMPRDPRYTDFDYASERIRNAEKSLSKFSQSSFVVGASSKLLKEVMWMESAEIWCSNLTPAEKLKNGKIAFIKLLIQSFSDQYISTLESDCKYRNKKYQLYMEAAHLGMGFSVSTSSGLSGDAHFACIAVQSAKDLVKAAADNLAQINSPSTK